VHSTANSYALRQSDLGFTYLNAASGKSISFRINNEDGMTLNLNKHLGIGTVTP